MISQIKLLIAKAINVKAIGITISYFLKDKIKYNSLVFDTSSIRISPYIKSMIFWGLYEKAEIKFANKYIKGDRDIIELGSSLGIVSCTLGKLKGDSKLICIEINPALIDIISANLKLNKIENVVVLNIGIGRSGDVLFFEGGEHNTHGKVLNFQTSTTLQVKLLSLSYVKEKYKIDDGFILVCDIEGSEIDIVLNEPSLLEKCSMIILESHDVSRSDHNYSYVNVKDLFLEIGFCVIDEYDNNYVLVNNKYAN